jgi:hypothetical protein
MDFRITGLSPEPFAAIFRLNSTQLIAHGGQRVIADDTSPGYPCRVSLAHAAPGEVLLLTSFKHQPARSPYQAAGPIFVRESATVAFDAVNTVPEPVRVRLLSVRAYDAADLIVDADVVDGGALEGLMDRYFQYENVRYLHIHYARRGCYACRVDRA